MSSLPDHKLVKRARHASNNLWLLGALAILGGSALIGMSASEGPISGQTWALGAIFGLLASGYFVLGTAARRGDQRSVAIVIAALVINVLVIVALLALNALQQRGPVSPDTTSVTCAVVGLLILLVLAQNYRELVELRQRGLWRGVFGSCKPGGHLCVVGGFLFVAGILGIYGHTFYFVSGAAARQAEMKQARGAIDMMLSNEEREFTGAMKNLGGSPVLANVEAAFAAAGRLEQKALTLQKEFSSNKTLAALLSTYISSTNEYKGALAMLQQPNPDVEQVRKKLLAAKDLRRDFGTRFAREYGPTQQEGFINTAQGAQ